MSDDERLREYEESVRPLFGTLMTPNSFWHRMSLQAFRSVVHGGYILPSGRGLQHTYPQSKECVATKLGAVSLFDFETEQRDRVIEQSIDWLQFMTDQGHPTLVLRLDKRSFVEGEVVTQRDLTRENRWPMLAATEEGGEIAAHHIPFVEVWHIGRIPAHKIIGVLVVSNHRISDYELISYREALGRLGSEWPRS